PLVGGAAPHAPRRFFPVPPPGAPPAQRSAVGKPAGHASPCGGVRFPCVARQSGQSASCQVLTLLDGSASVSSTPRCCTRRFSFGDRIPDSCGTATCANYNDDVLFRGCSSPSFASAIPHTALAHLLENPDVQPQTCEELSLRGNRRSGRNPGPCRRPRPRSGTPPPAPNAVPATRRPGATRPSGGRGWAGGQSA